MNTISMEELRYVDEKANANKFYRVYTWDTITVIQYGKCGTYGSFKRNEHASTEAAQKVSNKQRDAKYKKGYNVHKVATITLEDEPTNENLDRAATSAKNSGQETAQERAVATKKDAAVQLDITINPATGAAVDKIIDSYPKVDGEQISNVRPMLAANVTKAEIEECLTNPNWVAQLKLDGERYVIEIDNGTVSVYNRAGQAKINNISIDVVKTFAQITRGRWVFDGELVDGTLWIFDMLAADNRIDETSSFTTRHNICCELMSALSCQNVKLVDTAFSTEAKQKLRKDAQTNKQEGVIYRLQQSPYAAGRRSQDLLKEKFVKTVDCYVTRTGVDGKTNAELAVRNGNQDLVVGIVSTIGKGDIKIGDVVEICFLYVLDEQAPRLYQPRILNKRNDKRASECKLEQFIGTGKGESDTLQVKSDVKAGSPSDYTSSR